MQFILVCNSNVFDLQGVFKETSKISWPQIDGIEIGDSAYFYMSSPVSSILYKCIVNKVNVHKVDEITTKYVKHPLFYDNKQTYIQLEMIQSYSENFISDREILEKGFHNLQMSSQITEAFADYINKKEKKILKSGKVNKKWFVLAGGIVIAGILMAGMMMKKEPDADIVKPSGNNVQEQSQEEAPDILEDKKNQVVMTEDNDVIIEEEEEILSDISTLHYNITTVADYSQNLDSEEYLFYQSEQNREFNFYYPSKLYNNVEISENEEIKYSYGTVLEQIVFKGSDNESAARFELIKREPKNTRVEDTKLLYDNYKQNMIDFQKIIFHDGADERPGRIIAVGYKDFDRTVMSYLLMQITDEHIMRMQIDFPTDGNRNTEDFWQKEYVVECMYRFCGFSGSSKMPQTYQEFYNAKQAAGLQNHSDSTIVIKTDLRKYQNMTYSQYKEMTGADVGYWRDNVFGGDIPNLNISIAFRASYFDWDNWYQLQDHDLCYRLEGTLGILLEGIVGEMTIEELKNALSQETAAAKAEYGEGYAAVQTLSESWAVITFDSNQDGQYDAELHVDIMEKNTVNSETLAWVVFDLRDNYTEVLGWEE